jgi:hypothetical protein
VEDIYQIGAVRDELKISMTKNIDIDSRKIASGLAKMEELSVRTSHVYNKTFHL